MDCFLPKLESVLPKETVINYNFKRLSKRRIAYKNDIDTIWQFLLDNNYFYEKVKIFYKHFKVIQLAYEILVAHSLYIVDTHPRIHLVDVFNNQYCVLYVKLNKN